MDGKAPPSTPLRRIMHVDLDAFFVSVEQTRDSSLRGRPVVVGGDPGGRGVVASASYEARAYGLHAGMPLAQARRLCPDAVFVRGDYERYREVSSAFHAILEEVSPLVEPMGLDEAFVDLTGTDRLWGPAALVAQAARSRVRRELGITASVGIASSKTVAKVASDACKPDGLLEIAPGEESAFLSPLPLEALPGIGPANAEALRRLGVKTLGEIAALPIGTLHRAFGVWGEALHAHAKGIDPRPVSPPGLPKSMSRETTFQEDSLDRALLYGTLHYLTERVGADLRRHGALARQVQVKLRWADFTTVTRQSTLSQPSALDQTLYDAGRSL
ncbi:MAG: DNA polymerase IV, partial [SAR202 cluster bacterium]|nr:DNA polymerase IV [SAR202 cluster bacterium]